MQAYEDALELPPTDGRVLSDADRALARRLYQLRLELGLTQTEIGAMVGVSLQQWQKYERGLNRISPARLKSLCDATGLQIDDMFDKAEDDITPSEDGRQDRWTIDALRLFRDFTPEVRTRVLVIVRAIADIVSNRPLPKKPGPKRKQPQEMA